MSDRIELALKGICLGLVVILIWQVLAVLGARDPLSDVTVPALPASRPLAIIADSNGPPVSPLRSGAGNGTTAVVTSASALGSPTSPSNRAAARSAATRNSGAAKMPDLPPAVLARVEQIKESEVFGAIPKPLPMALLGIAGPDAFIRTASGQTGLLREGEELSGVKLLRVGTNRVLIEHEGQRKELTVFSGLGSESLLPNKGN